MNFDLQAFKTRHAVNDQTDPALRHCPEHGPYRVGEPLADGSWVHQHRECPACRIEALQRSRLEATPRRYRTAQLASSTASPAQALCARLLDRLDATGVQETAVNLWLYGPAGTGKTHLGHAVCAAATRQGRRAVFSSLRKILNDIRATWKPGSPERSEDVLQRLSEIPMLVIDEADKVHWSDNTRQLVFALLDLRYTADRPTVLISNATPEHLKPQMGFPSWDRLRESLVILATGRKSLRGADCCTTVLPVALYGQDRQTGFAANEPSKLQDGFIKQRFDGQIATGPLGAAVRSPRDWERSGGVDTRLAGA